MNFTDHVQRAECFSPSPRGSEHTGSNGCRRLSSSAWKRQTFSIARGCVSVLKLQQDSGQRSLCPQSKKFSGWKLWVREVTAAPDSEHCVWIQRIIPAEDRVLTRNDFTTVDNVSFEELERLLANHDDWPYSELGFFSIAMEHATRFVTQLSMAPH